MGERGRLARRLWPLAEGPQHSAELTKRWVIFVWGPVAGTPTGATGSRSRCSTEWLQPPPSAINLLPSSFILHPSAFRSAGGVPTVIWRYLALFGVSHPATFITREGPPGWPV